MTKKHTQKGFTIVELIIVMAVIAILLAIAIPVYINIVDKAKISTDLANLDTLNRVTAAYRFSENITNDDTFHGISTDEARMQKLVDTKYLSNTVSTVAEGESFNWIVDSQRWAYSLYELAGPGSASYLFSGLSLDDFLKTGSWHIGDEGFSSGYGLLFIDNSQDEYTLKSTAQLSEGTGGGYGILFETSLTDPDHDTGYVLQFDRGYNGIIIRPRANGSEGSPLLVLHNDDNSIIPASKSDEWWSQEHEITLQVTQSGAQEGTKIMSAWIDDTQIISDWQFESSVAADNNFTGFRSWGDTTVYSGLDIQ